VSNPITSTAVRRNEGLVGRVAMGIERGGMWVRDRAQAWEFDREMKRANRTARPHTCHGQETSS